MAMLGIIANTIILMTGLQLSSVKDSCTLQQTEPLTGEGFTVVKGPPHSSEQALVP